MEISCVSTLGSLSDAFAANFGFKHGCQQYLCSCRIVFECPPSVRDQGTMSVLPNQLLHLVFPHWTKIMLMSSQFDVIRIVS